MSQHPDLAKLARDIHGRSSLRGSILLMAILGCLVTAGLWAHLTELDSVTRVEGRIVPSADIQRIEAPEAGVLQSLLVQEGQIVDAGTLLMEFNRVQIDSQLKQEQQRAFGLMAREQRLEAEISGVPLSFDAHLIREAVAMVQAETALYQGRKADLAAEIAILKRQREQREQELDEQMVELVTARETLQVLTEERNIISPLVADRMEPATSLLALRRSEAEWVGHKTRAKAATARLKTSMTEIDDRIEAARNRFRSSALTDLAATTAELATLKPILPALRDRSARTKIRSPVRGVVNRIHRTTIGGTARGGEELIEIVPLDESLLVEAYVRPEDIAFLYPRQPVKIKITAYDFARYGALNGEIVRIGADTVARSERDDEKVFVVEIRTDRTLLDADGIAVEIIPGMLAEVDILTGRKTVLNYVLQPVMKIKDRALRE